jgi:hypothetical protein
MEKLHMREPYHVKEHVYTADGLGMRMSHVVQALLSTPSSRPLYLSNIFNVPSLT